MLMDAITACLEERRSTYYCFYGKRYGLLAHFIISGGFWTE